MRGESSADEVSKKSNPQKTHRKRVLQNYPVDKVLKVRSSSSARLGVGGGIFLYVSSVGFVRFVVAVVLGLLAIQHQFMRPHGVIICSTTGISGRELPSINA